MSLTMKRRITVLATVISSLLIAGVVFAAFTADATGTGSAESFEVLTTSTIDFGSPVTGLYPGQIEQTDITIINTQAFPVEISSVSGLTAVQDETTPCDETLVSASWDSGDGPVGEQLAATGSSAAQITSAVNVTMDTAAENECAGLDFDFDLGAVLTSVPDNS